MKIETLVKGHGPMPGTAMTLYAVTVSFDGPVETLTLTVVVPTQTDAKTGENLAIARAKEIAREFVEQASV